MANPTPAPVSPFFLSLLCPFLFLCSPVFANGSVDSPAPELKTSINNSYGKLPIRFEANMGQTDARVKFLARGKGYSLFLTPQSAVMVLPIGPTKTESNSIKKISLENNELRSAAIRMSLLNANPSPEMLGEDQLVTKSAYFIGADPAKWRKDVANYGSVRYKESYPGIDLIYYGNLRQLEYDFVVSPGANPDVIKIKFSGQDKVEIDDAGNLILQAGLGRVVQSAPVVYQTIGGERISIDGRYVLLGEDSVGFHIGQYDREKVLVIDPLIELSTFAGGSANDFGNGVALDASGKIYITGIALSADFPTLGGVDSALDGTSDAFVVKLNATGSAAIYSTYLGGSGTDDGNAIAVDSSGAAYVIGSTASTDFPTVGPIDATLSGTQDGFVAKLNASGSTLIYSTYLGGSGTDFGNTIAVDAFGEAYAAGRTESTDFPTAGVIDATLGGVQDAYVSRLNAAGSALSYSTYLGGSANDFANGIAVDVSRNAYVTGNTFSTDFPTASPFQAAAGGGDSDGFIAKINATGTALTYSTYIGGNDVDDGNAIAVDASGNVYVTGGTLSADFPVAGPIDAVVSDKDVFVLKLNASGSALTYSTYLGGSGLDVGNAIAVDSSGAAYVTGNTFSTDFPVASAVQTTAGGGDSDAFVAKLNVAGSALTYSTYLGGAGVDNGNGIAVDASGNAHVVGDTASSDFPLTGIVLDTTLGGSQDAYIVKIVESPVVPPFNPKTGVVSPYWQSEAGIYTFIAVNHPFLSGMNSQIGVAMTAVNGDGGLRGTLEFTVLANETQRVFITPFNFSFNSQTNGSDRFLIAGNSPQSGRLQFSPVASNPESFAGIANSFGKGFPDVTALSFWGAIVVLNTATGFAMEFIGDMQESRAFSSANFSGVN